MANTPWHELPFDRWHNSPRGCIEKDFQRSRCYSAEGAVRSSIPNNPQFKTVEECQTFIDSVMSKAWFKRRFPGKSMGFKVIPWGRIVVQDGRGSYRARAWRGRMAIPNWARNPLVLLHELIHCVTPVSVGCPHGRYWARAFLSAVRHQMGKEAHNMLRDSFRTKRVKFHPKRIVSEGVRKAASERMKAYHQNKE